MRNEYEIRGDVTAIFIKSKKYGKLETLISTNKLERVKEYKNSWYVYWNKITESFYVNSNYFDSDGKKRGISLHRWVTDASRGMEVDHRNHDTLDNTDENLRICTHGENQQNRKGANVVSSSGIRGVYWAKDRNKWSAKIRLNKKLINIGYFSEIKDAEYAVKDARSKYMEYSYDSFSGGV